MPSKKIIYPPFGNISSDSELWILSALEDVSTLLHKLGGILFGIRNIMSVSKPEIFYATVYIDRVDFLHSPHYPKVYFHVHSHSL